ncbi:YbaB/EbfC family nucleoid-associated protein [Amycolatopsis sp. NPDC004625]|uniref:YbaB/EbfC family nucleoid-associated protein n=1 Tax=Amycolatopsis sp. NPDC004625 TaxID=3154670 RepID=UPI0033BC32F2
MNNAQLIEEMRWQLKQIEDRRAENQRALDGITGGNHTTVVSPDRSVTVLAGPGGISEVRLAPEAMRLDAGALSRTITAAVREAVAVGGRPVAGVPQPAEPPRQPAPGQQSRRPPSRKRAPAEEEDPYDTVFDV